MRKAIVFISLLGVLVTSLAWAGDLHAVSNPDKSESVHHQNDNRHAPPVHGCHVFHCQASAHLSTIPVSLYVANVEVHDTPIPTITYAEVCPGVISSPWRPPTV